jgi:transcription initiation factor TFIIF subunit alpha
VKNDVFLTAIMPPKHDLSLLFHPKKKPIQKQNRVNGNHAPTQAASVQVRDASPQKSRPTPPAAGATPTTSQATVDDEDIFQLPNTQYSEFRILSSALQGWKYDVMKFDSRKNVDINRWQQPIKLNRKDLRMNDTGATTTAVPQAVGPMLGPDGKPVIGVDGKVVMVDVEGKPIHPDSHHLAGPGANGAAGGKDKGKGPAGKKRFQKKTRQVFPVPEHQRQLRKEERYPWVMEDSSSAKEEYWVGHLEEVSKADTHGFFMPAANDAFKFVPAHRWYKFQKKIKHDLPTDTANVDALVLTIWFDSMGCVR